MKRNATQCNAMKRDETQCNAMKRDETQCNAPEADTDTDTDVNQNHLSEVASVDNSLPENATRKGGLCKQLRMLGIDAAPHLDAWSEILPVFSDAEIMAVAESAREKKPGERLHLNYLLTMLRDKQRPPARDSPKRAATGRQARIDNYAAEAAAARGDHGRTTGGSAGRDITGEATRIA